MLGAVGNGHVALRCLSEMACDLGMDRVHYGRRTTLGRRWRRRCVTVPCHPRSVLLAALFTGSLLLVAAATGAQAFATVKGKAPIPREAYKTWSLFLVTNQDWLVPANAQRLVDLYWRSEAFGRVIGDDHLAVWFWKKDAPLTGAAAAENVDVERATAYCKRLQLKPSDGPYLLFTATYPDESTAPDAFTAIALGSKSADDVAQLLKQLGDQLVIDGVIRDRTLQHAAGSDDFWSAWFDATRHALAKLGSGFRFVVRTPSFTIESGLSRD